jgi:hypothetical protein
LDRQLLAWRSFLARSERLLPPQLIHYYSSHRPPLTPEIMISPSLGFRGNSPPVDNSS